MHRPPRFYITAESKASCRALWCSVPGTENRRVASLGKIAPSVHVMAAGTPPTTTAAPVPVAPKGQAGTVAREIDGCELAGSFTQLRDEKRRNTLEDRHARKMKAQAKEATAAAAAAKVAAIAAATTRKRAAALSAALIEADEEAASASRAGRAPLFTSSTDFRGGLLRAEGLKAGFGNGNDEEQVNIAVVSRCRPLLVREMRRGVRAAVFSDGNEIVVSDELLPNKRPRRFGFDRVFGERSGTF